MIKTDDACFVSLGYCFLHFLVPSTPGFWMKHNLLRFLALVSLNYVWFSSSATKPQRWSTTHQASLPSSRFLYSLLFHLQCFFKSSSCSVSLLIIRIVSLKHFLSPSASELLLTYVFKCSYTFKQFGLKSGVLIQGQIFLQCVLFTVTINNS